MQTFLIVLSLITALAYMRAKSDARKSYAAGWLNAYDWVADYADCDVADKLRARGLDDDGLRGVFDRLGARPCRP